MSKNIDYGGCNHCGYRFYTYVDAYDAIMPSKCPKCGGFIGLDDITDDVKVAMRLKR